MSGFLGPAQYSSLVQISGVLFFFESVLVVLDGFASECDFLFVVCFRIERRVYVDEFYLPPEFFEEVRHDLEVVAPEDLVHPGAVRGGFAVAFFELGGVKLSAF